MRYVLKRIHVCFGQLCNFLVSDKKLMQSKFHDYIYSKHTDINFTYELEISDKLSFFRCFSGEGKYYIFDWCVWETIFNWFRNEIW